MRGVRALLLAGCVIAVSAAASLATTSSRPERVTLIGDSVAERIAQIPAAAEALERGFSVRYRLAVCRRVARRSCSYAGIRPGSVLDEVKALGPRIDDVVVLDAGYNDTPRDFADGADRVMRALVRRKVTHVVWVTLHERQRSYVDINRTIRALARRWPRLVRVADWGALSSGQPWFEADDVHLNTDGAIALATLLRTTVVAACGTACSGGSIAPPLQPTPSGVQRCPQRAGGQWASVLGTASMAAQALALQRRAISGGFGQSVIVQALPGTFEVVLFGFATRDDAVTIFLEAKQRGFHVTPLPNTGPCNDLSGEWETVFGHTKTMAEAVALRARVAAAELKLGVPEIETDGPGDFEIEIEGIQSTSQFTEVAERARRSGFIVSFEPS